MCCALDPQPMRDEMTCDLKEIKGNRLVLLESWQRGGRRVSAWYEKLFAMGVNVLWMYVHSEDSIDGHLDVERGYGGVCQMPIKKPPLQIACCTHRADS